MKRWIPACVALCALGLLLAMRCRPDGPGSRGNVRPVPDRDAPDEVNANAIIELEISDPIPDPLACDTPYVIASHASEVPVECEGYSYALLYREALRHADERIAELQCKPECPQRNPYIVMQEGMCAAPVARVAMDMAVQCRAEDAPSIQGLPILVDSELRAPFTYRSPDAPGTGNERIAIELRPNDLSEDCPFDYKFWITLRESVATCDGVAFDRFVQRAEREAAKIWGASQCGPDCTKAPLVEVGARWACAQNLVTVEYVFEVPCRPQ